MVRISTKENLELDDFDISEMGSLQDAWDFSTMRQSFMSSSRISVQTTVKQTITGRYIRSSSLHKSQLSHLRSSSLGTNSIIIAPPEPKITDSQHRLLHNSKPALPLDDIEDNGTNTFKRQEYIMDKPKQLDTLKAVKPEIQHPLQPKPMAILPIAPMPSEKDAAQIDPTPLFKKRVRETVRMLELFEKLYSVEN
jgi:hypothetical protein